VVSFLNKIEIQDSVVPSLNEIEIIIVMHFGLIQSGVVVVADLVKGQGRVSADLVVAPRNGIPGIMS